jgi:hypothetical protein
MATFGYSFDPIVPDPEWGRPSPDIPDEEIYDDDELEDDD